MTLIVPTNERPDLEFQRMGRADGALIVDGIEVAHFRQCPHCGCQWLSVKGSGIKRHFCTRCMAMTCGGEKCIECIPFEAKLEHAEGKRNKYTDAIIAQGIEGCF